MSEMGKQLIEAINKKFWLDMMIFHEIKVTDKNMHEIKRLVCEIVDDLDILL